MYFNTKQLRQSELTLLQINSQLERTQMVTIFMLAMQNTRLVGYMLPVIRSMFLSTNGNVAWLYHCPKLSSLRRVLDKCFDRIPILFERIIQFLDPIKLQTFDFASEISCLCDYTTVLQLDFGNDKSWYQLLPDPMPFIKTLLLKRTQPGHITQLPLLNTRRAGM